MAVLVTASFMPIFSDERVVASASSEHISYLPVVETGKYDAAFTELLLQAAQRIDVDFCTYLESLGVLNYVPQMCDC